jgi:hypothetical protein
LFPITRTTFFSGEIENQISLETTLIDLAGKEGPHRRLPPESPPTDQTHSRSNSIWVI